MCLLKIDFSIVVLFAKVIAGVIVGITVLELNGQAYGCPSPILRCSILIHVTENSCLDMDLNAICSLLF
jgi:hypothetical protein